MSSIFNRSVIAPTLAAVVAFTAGYAIADEAPLVPKRVQTQSAALTPAQTQSPSIPCPTASQAAHGAGMRQGGREMHDQMMQDHQMGSGGSQGMPMGAAAPSGMPMGCNGKPGCMEKMPKSSNGKSGSMAPGADSSPMPMKMPMDGHM